MPPAEVARSEVCLGVGAVRVKGEQRNASVNLKSWPTPPTPAHTSELFLHNVRPLPQAMALASTLSKGAFWAIVAGVTGQVLTSTLYTGGLM